MNTIVGFAGRAPCRGSMEWLRALMTTQAEATRDGGLDEIDDRVARHADRPGPPSHTERLRR